MVSLKNTLLASALLVAGAASAAHADVYTVDAYTGDIGYGFNSVIDSAALFTSANHSQHATFTYTGALNFNDTLPQNNSTTGDLNSKFFGANAAGISNYKAITSLYNADYGSFASLNCFLDASGSIDGYKYGSLYLITDTSSYAAGTSLTILHDDGVGVYSNGALLPGTTTGPTVAVTETVRLPKTGPFTIAYGRENGTPSVLDVAVATPVPEPMTLSLLGAGLIGLGMVRRRGA